MTTYAIRLKQSLQHVDTAYPPTEQIIYLFKSLPGTRAPFHTHDYSGRTCIVRGQMTFLTNDTALVRTGTIMIHWLAQAPTFFLSSFPNQPILLPISK